MKSIFTAFCFVFLLKKSAAYRFIRETYDENVRAIRTCVNWFKRFKNGDFDINDNAPDILQL